MKRKRNRLYKVAIATNGVAYYVISKAKGKKRVKRIQTPKSPVIQKVGKKFFN